MALDETSFGNFVLKLYKTFVTVNPACNLTCPFAKFSRRYDLPVSQDPDSEAGQKPIDGAQRDPGRGDSTEAEQRSL